MCFINTMCAITSVICIFTFMYIMYCISLQDWIVSGAAIIIVCFQFVFLGGPFNCGEPLPKNITISGMPEPHNKSISIVLCGKQEPRVYWFINGEEINTGVNSTKIGSHEYLYEVNFIKQTLCGGVLSYNATGHGKDISGSTNLLVDCKYI